MALFVDIRNIRYSLIRILNYHAYKKRRQSKSADRQKQGQNRFGAYGYAKRGKSSSFWSKYVEETSETAKVWRERSDCGEANADFRVQCNES